MSKWEYFQRDDFDLIQKNVNIIENSIRQRFNHAFDKILILALIFTLIDYFESCQNKYRLLSRNLFAL